VSSFGKVTSFFRASYDAKNDYSGPNMLAFVSRKLTWPCLKAAVKNSERGQTMALWTRWISSPQTIVKSE
jgi:hypothetical protein